MTDDCLVACCEGKLGSGKSYRAMIQAVTALMRGQVLVTNSRLNWEPVDRYCRKRGVIVPKSNYRYFETEAVMEDPDYLLTLLTEGSFLLFDEVHLVLDSRNWQANSKKADALQTLCTQARKNKVDMLFITQAKENTDNRILRQCTYFYRCRNWLHFPFFGTLFPFPVTVVFVCGEDGKTVLDRELYWRRKSIFALYNTNQVFKRQNFGGAAAAPVVGRMARKVDYAFYMIAMALVLIFIDWAVWGRSKIAAAQAAASKPPPVTVAKPAAAFVPAPGLFQPAPVKPAPPVKLDPTAFEAALPRIRRHTGQAIYLNNGYVLRIGSRFGRGLVRGWRLESGSITVFCDSPTMPEITLYDTSRPLVADSSGFPTWSSAGAQSRPVASGPLQRSFVAPDGVAGQAPALQDASSSPYVPPPVFYPDDSGYRSVPPEVVRAIAVGFGGSRP